MSEESEQGLHKLSFHFAEIRFPKEASGIKSSYLPAYCINYDYVLNSHWSIGSHNDILLENLEENGESNSHNRPVTTKLIGAYHVTKHLGYSFGFGDEVNGNENVLLTTFGADYAFLVKSTWEIGAEVNYDMKFSHANNWVFGFGITKIIGKHHKS